MGSMIPIDGEVVDGEAMINESSFTREPLSKYVKKNDTVFAGTLVEEGKLFIRVRNLQDESRISNIVKMIDTNESLKASIQAKAEYLADSIVPFSFLGFFGVLALTNANPTVKKVVPLNGYTRDEVLRIAACLEEHFPHSVANAIVNQAKKKA